MTALTDFERLKLETGFRDKQIADVVGDAVDKVDVLSANAPANATITLATPVSTARAITIQLKDAAGNNLTAGARVGLYVFAGATGATLATTGGSTGIAIGASGVLVTHTAKKVFEAVSDDSGVIALSWTDNASEVAYLGVVLGNGTIVRSAALTI